MRALRSRGKRHDLLRRTLRSPDAWSRSYALAELRFMAARRTDLFTPARRAALKALAARSPYPEVGPGLEVVEVVVEGAARRSSSRGTQQESSPS